MALRPYSPKLTLLPTVATPLLRPFCSFRYFLLAGCSILRSCSCGGSGCRAARTFRRFGRGRRRLCRLGVVRHHLALEHPYLDADDRSEEHTSELQSRRDLVCRLLLE